MLTECLNVRLKFPKKLKKGKRSSYYCCPACDQLKELKEVSVPTCPPNLQQVVQNKSVSLPPIQIRIVVSPNSFNLPRIPATPSSKRRVRIRGTARKRALLQALADW